MTTNLDKYRPASWQENGMMMANPKPADSPRPRKRETQPLTATIIFSIACAAVTLAPKFVLSNPTGEACIVTHHQPSTYDTGRELLTYGDYISSNTWPGLMKVLGSLPAVEEADGPDPEPFF
jgi:hypothetical protein